jgi:tetratricopeptide (TPR) repeat protein
MNRCIVLGLLLAATIPLESCGPAGETGKTPGGESKEGLYRSGHQYFLNRDLVNAAEMLDRALQLDSVYTLALSDLAEVHYELGMKEQGEKSPARIEHFRASRTYLARLESLGILEPTLYERLCELSVALDDNRSFLKYAKKNAEKYPFDRQLYNLGIAYYETGDYASVIKTMKDASEKFKSSPYIGGFYRQLGLAYMKIDRDQTAVRTLETGVQIVNARLADLRKSGADPSSSEYRRLGDDRVGMLVSLRKIHQTYKEQAKLEKVERLLREAGYLK